MQKLWYFILHELFKNVHELDVWDVKDFEKWSGDCLKSVVVNNGVI